MNLTCCFIAVGVVNHNILSNIFLVVLTDQWNTLSSLHWLAFTYQCFYFVDVFVDYTCIHIFSWCCSICFFQPNIAEIFYGRFWWQRFIFLSHIPYCAYQISDNIYTETFYMDLFYSSKYTNCCAQIYADLYSLKIWGDNPYFYKQYLSIFSKLY